MKISVRNLEPTKVKLTVTVDPEEFNPYLDEARKEIAKQVNVPGFRKGHPAIFTVIHQKRHACDGFVCYITQRKFFEL